MESTQLCFAAVAWHLLQMHLTDSLPYDIYKHLAVAWHMVQLVQNALCMKMHSYLPYLLKDVRWAFGQLSPSSTSSPGNVTAIKAAAVIAVDQGPIAPSSTEGTLKNNSSWTVVKDELSRLNLRVLDMCQHQTVM